MRVIIFHRPGGLHGGDVTASSAFTRELIGLGIDAEERPAAYSNIDGADYAILWGACSPEWGLPMAQYIRQRGTRLLVVAEWWSRRQRLDYFFHFDKDVAEGYTYAVGQTLATGEVVLVSTMSEAQEVWKIVPRAQVHVIGRGCDPVLCNPVEMPQDYVSCLARVEKHKNQVNLAHACRELGVPLKLVGAVADEPYAQIARGLGAELCGALPHEDAIEVLANSRVHALVSFFESAGLASMEAMQLGVPAVMGKVGCQVELFGTSGLYADPASWHDIRDAISEAWIEPRVIKRVPTWADVAKRAAQWMEANQ